MVYESCKNFKDKIKGTQKETHIKLNCQVARKFSRKTAMEYEVKSYRKAAERCEILYKTYLCEGESRRRFCFFYSFSYFFEDAISRAEVMNLRSSTVAIPD